MTTPRWQEREGTLLFRRQFVLGPRFLDGFPQWKRVELRSGLHLTVHPDLRVTRAGGAADSVTLLGYLLDPLRPADGDAEIVGRLLGHLEAGGTRESLIQLTHPMGGRWILLVETERERWLFHDPCGHREVVYTEEPRPLWCATDPAILAGILGLSMDREALRFYRTYRRRDPQYAWPVGTSPYREIRRLLPNHFLDLRSRSSVRYWPRGNLPRRTVHEVVLANAQLLQGIVESASRRFPLALGLTAGRDTRTALAASKPLRDRLYCFTSLWGPMNRDSPDIRVPSQLLAHLGMQHHVIVCPSHADKGFERILRQSVATAHDCYAPIVQGEYRSHHQDRVSMMGNSMPILRVPQRRRLQRWRPHADIMNLDAEALVLCGYRTDSFSLAAIDTWLSGVPETNIPALDLFYWEQHEGCWEAMTLAEWDLARDSFSPYNCRRFLENGLSVPESDRGEPGYALHRMLMERMWPEVLDVPFNPPERPNAYSTVFTALDRLREKISKRPPETPGTPVVRTFQRHPWLTDVARIRWQMQDVPPSEGAPSRVA